MTCVHLLPQAKFEFKDSSIQHKNGLICCFKPPYLPMNETIFCQKTEVSAATSSLHVEQNLVHLGRFLRFRQKVVGMNLNSQKAETNTEQS